MMEYSKGRVRALSIDTGVKFPEIVTFRDYWAAQWQLDLTIARPTVDLASYPIARERVTCCRDLKVLPLGRAVREMDVAVVITGLRRDEHFSRGEREYLEPRGESEVGPAYVQANVILDWTEMDVWAFLTGRALPYCDLYTKGYRSLGCMPCTSLSGIGGNERSGRDQEKERNLERLRSLGYF